MRKVLEICLAVTLLCSGAFAAFIQSPIPPSSKQNFFRDMDGDGRMDRIVLRFLGAISDEYIKEMIDSLDYTWIDSTGLVTRYMVPASKMRVDSASVRQVLVDLDQNAFENLTTPSSIYMPVGSYGTLNLYLTDSTVFHVNMRDGMAPAILDAHIKSYRGRRVDSLRVNFTEWTETVDWCDAILEFKKAKDSTVRFLPASSVEWSMLASRALFLFDEDLALEKRLSPGDSLRITEGCLKDTSGNAVPSGGGFVEVKGFFPFDLKTSNLIEDDGTASSNDAPVFQLLFRPMDEPEEEIEKTWDMTMEILGSDFENALRNAEGLESQEPIDPSKLKITYNVRIYTNLGAYVAGSSSVVMGDDSRFETTPTKLTLRWNLLDAHRRRVSTGAYIANVFATIEYNGRIVYRSDVDASSVSRVFGVTRR
ncbi:hypothetical protein [Fibrobacter sp. UWR2]|jgi:hypothetical protein|uniref:hypothetical protein n=1 Tax=Fibrobacter sp. UWR2 TaxID=1964352 RepID=UPI000B524267|nr:hypothetical protein [Fibrobacter sp. UWR2]OWU99455.1 hypothetical protein B7994_10715 [Fibrobacter sp. UWR2]